MNDVATSELDGLTRIAAQATQNLSSFNLDFIGFEITSIVVNGQPAEFTRRGQELTITPLTSLAQNEPFTVEVRYQGSPGEMNSTAIPIQTGWVTFDGGSFVLSEPDGAATFYPVNDHPLDKASYTFRVRVPEPFEVAANGILMETVDNGTTTTFLFEARDPMASYLATVNIDEFDIETSQAENGIPIRNYFPTGLSEDYRRPFERQDEMLVYFSDIFGPYPFEVYGALLIDKQFGAALETQTLSIFSIAMLDPQQPQGSEEVVAHELAHQWFGDSVSVGDWSDIWLNESFATYSQVLWLEHTRGRNAVDERIREMYAVVLQNRESMSPPGKPPADGLFNLGVYYWGALSLHALRLEVGDERTELVAEHPLRQAEFARLVIRCIGFAVALKVDQVAAQVEPRERVGGISNGRGLGGGQAVLPIQVRVPVRGEQGLNLRFLLRQKEDHVHIVERLPFRKQLVV